MIPNFIEICIGDKYVIRFYKERIEKSEFGNLSATMTLDEWNEHDKNMKWDEK